MNILFFSRLFYPHIGGVEKHVLEISRRMVKDGHSVTVITENHSWRKIESVEGIKVYRVNMGNNEFLKKFRIWWWLCTNIHIIKSADIIHCHDVFIWYLPFALLFPLKNTYTTFHGYEGNNIPGIKAKIMHKIAEFMSNKNICVGEFLEKWYTTKASLITYGAVYPQKDAVLPKLSKKISAVFLGRLEEETGILEYLKAVKLLKSKGVSVWLTVLGDGTLRKRCEDFVHISKLNVTFTGFVENTNKYVKKADVVFVSRYLGILEALSCKKYVFATFNNEIKKDYLSMTPFAKFIWIGKDFEATANNVLKTIKTKKLKEKVEKGCSWANLQTWEKLVSDYYRLWKLVV